MNKEDLDEVFQFTFTIVREHVNELTSNRRLPRENKLTAGIRLQVWFPIASKVFHEQWIKNDYDE